ncbi:MAG: XrtA/PEP-CTERM system TPR-repeat protein PrsT [Pseudomonadota bacterium]
MTPRHASTPILLLVLALSAPLVGCDATARLTEQEHIQRAKDFEDKGDLRGSIIELKNAIQKNPDSPQARLLLGQVYLKAGLGAEAEKELVRAESLGVNRESIKPQLGEALVLMGEYKRVLDEINPGEKTSRVNRARIYQVRADALLRSGKLGDACALYQQSLEVDKSNPPTYWGLAQCAVAERNLPKAKHWLDEALKLPSQQARSWIFVGDWAQLNRDPKAALAAYTQALKAEPNQLTALQSRAALQMALGQLDAAQADVDKVAKLAPKSLSAHYLKGLLSFERQDYAAARESLQAIFKITSNHLPSVLLAGATDYSLGSYGQAETHLARYLERFPGHRYARRLLAATQIKQGQPDRALTTLAPLLTPDNLDAQVLVVAAEAYRLKGEHTQAADYLARAAALDPSNASIQAQLGFNRLAAGDSQTAISELNRASALDPTQHHADVLLVMAHLDRKEYDQALAAVDALEKKLKNSPATHTMRGNALFGKKDYAGARASFERALGIDPAFLPAVTSLAELDLRDKRPDAARKRFEQVLSHDKNNLAAMMALADFAAQARREQEHVGWLERAAKAHPAALPPRAALVRHLLGKKEFQKALAIANETLGANPDNPAALELLGSVQLAMQDHPGALSTFTRLAQKAEHSADAQLRLAVAQIAGNRLADARATLDKALKLQPGHEPSVDALIQLEMRANKPDQALQIARRHQASRPQSPLGFEREGDVLLAQKRHDLAAKAYTQALIQGAGPEAFVKLHRADVLAGNAATADSKLAQWLRQNPQDPVVRLYAADYFAASGRIQDAVAAYQAVLGLVPDSTAALNNLASLYQKLGDRRARATAEQAYKREPGNPAVLDTLGWILVQDGQAGRGLELLNRALAGLPGNPTVRYHRAVALARSGDKAGGRRELEALLRSAPDFPEAEAARAELKKL